MFDLLGMLQLEKPVILYGRTVTSSTRTKVTALQIKTPVCDKILRRELRTPFVTCKQSGSKWTETKQRNWHKNCFCFIESHDLDKK